MLTRVGAAELGSMLGRREVSARDVVEAHWQRIEESDATVGAFLARDHESAMALADKAQSMLDAGHAGPLTGVPIAVKDNVSTKGLETTCGSKILEGYVPPFDATVVEKVVSAGLVVLGKTNLDEFAMGTSCENSALATTVNPWDTGRVPGGSSGGSAAAVAAGQTPLALGSDTGGSIRMPAGLCGIVGFKPTYGRVSRYGLVAFGSSLDQIGPMARSVEDVALLSAAVSGHDPRDSTSLPGSAISATGLKQGSLKGLRLGVPKQCLEGTLEPGVRDAFDAACARLRAEGATVTEVDLPSIDLGVSTYYIIAPAEASSNLARFDGIRFGPRVEGSGHVDTVARTRGTLFGHEVKLRIMVGTYALSAGYYDDMYVKAQKVRGMMTAEFERSFHDFDLVMSPTSPVVAFPKGTVSEDHMALKSLDLCTIPANMGGFPSLSLPCGLSEGLPVGLCLTGPVNSDERLLQSAFAIESALAFQSRPTIW